MQFPRNEVLTYSMLQPIAFASKRLTSTETHLSNIEREALGILQCIEKFHHYCFTFKVSVITKHKVLVEIFKKYVASPSDRLQRILLQLCQYNVRKLYKPGPKSSIAVEHDRTLECLHHAYVSLLLLLTVCVQSLLDHFKCNAIRTNKVFILVISIMFIYLRIFMNCTHYVIYCKHCKAHIV